MQQQYLEDSERDLIFQNLRNIPENKKCFDCTKKNPNWASVYLGLLLCYDCAGKHRQFGVQYSFVRSLEYDKWNKRQIAFMEIGGNARAQEYFTKRGLATPFDYKSVVVANYKNEQTKKVDAMLGSNEAVSVTQNVEEVTASTGLGSVAFGTKADGQATNLSNPFNTMKIDKDQTKTKGFTVEFTKRSISKTNSTTNKNRIAAKKIDNVDLDILTLLEGETNLSIPEQNPIEAIVKQFPEKQKANEIEPSEQPPQNNKQLQQSNEIRDLERLKMFKNAKSISSSAFKNDSKNDEQNVNIIRNKFAGATAISSSQYNAEQKQGVNAKEFFSNVGGKLKGAAGSIGTIFTKIKTQNNNSDMTQKAESQSVAQTN